MGALWIIAVAVVFLGLLASLPAASVTTLEKVYALLLIVGVVWLARRATSSEKAAKGGSGCD